MMVLDLDPQAPRKSLTGFRIQHGQGGNHLDPQAPRKSLTQIDLCSYRGWS